MHQSLLAATRPSRAERAHALACLGTDYRKAGFLDRAARAFRRRSTRTRATSTPSPARRSSTRSSASGATPTSPDASRPAPKDRRRPRSRLPPGGDRAGAPSRARERPRPRSGRPSPSTAGSSPRGWAWRTSGPDAETLASGVDPRGAPSQSTPERAYLAFDRLSQAYGASGEPSQLRRALRADHPAGPARLAGPPRPGPPPTERGTSRRGARPAPCAPLEANPQILLVHLEIWRTLRAMGISARTLRALRGYRREVRPLPRPPHLHRLPLPRRRHALAVPPLPRLEHLRRGTSRALVGAPGARLAPLPAAGRPPPQRPERTACSGIGEPFRTIRDPGS